MNYFYSLPIQINIKLYFIFKISKGRLDWTNGRNGLNSVLGWSATHRKLYYTYKEKRLTTIRKINSFLSCFKSNCKLVCAEHISHSSSSFSASSIMGFKHRIQMQAIFLPAEGSEFFGKLCKLLCRWFKTSLWACHVVRAVWVALSFWTPFSFDSPSIPADAGT